MPTKSARPKTGKSTTNNPILSDDEETDYFDLPKAERLDNAYSEYLDPDNTKSERQLVREHGVSRGGLQHRIKGGQGKAYETENRQRLTHLEEEALKDWCLQLEAWGFPARVEALRRMVKDMLVEKGDYEKLGKNWQASYFQRHLELKSKFIPPLDKERARAQNPEVF
jgi:hypothetical protein